jgi:Na+/H+-dicarboxylate symporter/ABC-type amino acid transport substrate-binding protein
MSVSLYHRNLIGLLAGVALGLFIGDIADLFEVIGTGYIRLLQMTVLPYIVISLVGSLSTLNFSLARVLFLKVGLLLLALWGLTLVVTFLMPLAFPTWDNATFFSLSLLDRPDPPDFLQLYIPSNPFNSLANAVVPAVVLFSIAMGLALIGIEKKQPLLDLLGVLEDALSRITQFVVRLTPIGIFAIAASQAGTMTFEEISRIQVYFASYIVCSLLLGLWILPHFVAALTPFRYREVVRAARDALVTAFMTGSLFVVLPILTQRAKELFHERELTDDVSKSMTEIIVPASFNFPHAAKILSLSFILFAAWFADAAVRPDSYLRLATVGLMVSFGSTAVSIPFLLDLFRIPADLFQLYLATGVLNSRFGAMLSAMHTMTLVLTGTCAVLGILRIDWLRLARMALGSTALVVACLLGINFLFTTFLSPDHDMSEVVTSMQLVTSPHPHIVLQDASSGPLPLPRPGQSRLEAIRERGFLRVGFLLDNLPYSYFNRDGDLVGLDIDLALELGRDLELPLQFVPLTIDCRDQPLDPSVCDLLISGVPITPNTLQYHNFSVPYLHETAALMVRDHRRAEFKTMAGFTARKDIAIAMPARSLIIERWRAAYPNLGFVTYDGITTQALGELGEADAILTTAERGSVWCLIHPEYSIVIPEDLGIGVPLAVSVAGASPVLLSRINSWIHMQQSLGTTQRLYDYWILGQNTDISGPRWSVIRNVLHWVD